jgi:ATP-binding protein involved in chromosome partitioning
LINNVKSVVAVASGKGGVGKSTVAVNLALGLCHGGYDVGLLDADVYGPSIAKMLGVNEGTRPESVDGKKLSPIKSFGLSTMSMSYLVTETTPMAWRGPMASGALKQMLHCTDWGTLDVLLVDMPPGTGDIQLTLSQQIALAGVIIVTTPQDIALLDAKRGIEMFSKMHVPILGVVENMAMHECKFCGQSQEIFGTGGGTAIASEYNTVLLGQLALDRDIREYGDQGIPVIAADATSKAALACKSMADSVGRILSSRQENEPELVID